MRMYSSFATLSEPLYKRTKEYFLLGLRQQLTSETLPEDETSQRTIWIRCSSNFVLINSTSENC